MKTTEEALKLLLGNEMNFYTMSVDQQAQAMRDELERFPNYNGWSEEYRKGVKDTLRAVIDMYREQRGGKNNA